MIPTRKTRAKKAKSVFFRNHNDIDIYVEDTEIGTIKLYTILFQRAFEGRYQINRIYPLGGKLEVLKCWQNRSPTTCRKELYVIDSDFSLASHEKKRAPYNSSGTGLFYTTRFCIENYLIDEMAAVSYLDKKDTQKNRDELKRALNFQQWIAKISTILKKLFFHLYTARAISVDIPVMRWGYSNIVKNAQGDLDNSKVNKICHQIKKFSLKYVSEDEWKTLYANITTELVSKFSNNIQYYVCAKNFLLGLLILKMKSITDHREKNVLIKQSLARNTSLSILRNELRAAI